MSETTIKIGDTVTITFLPGHPLERVITGKVVQAPYTDKMAVHGGRETFDYITVPSPNVRIDKVH